MLERICNENEILLILDEVIAGFRFRAGNAGQLYGVEPDLTTLGKIIGGGLPAAAYGGRAEIMDALAPTGGVYQAAESQGVSHAAILVPVSLQRQIPRQGDLSLLAQGVAREARAILTEMRGLEENPASAEFEAGDRAELVPLGARQEARHDARRPARDAERAQPVQDRLLEAGSLRHRRARMQWVGVAREPVDQRALRDHVDVDGLVGRALGQRVDLLHRPARPPEAAVAAPGKTPRQHARPRAQRAAAASTSICRAVAPTSRRKPQLSVTLVLPPAPGPSRGAYPRPDTDRRPPVSTRTSPVTV